MKSPDILEVFVVAEAVAAVVKEEVEARDFSSGSFGVEDW